jgi:hypothetical protein
MAKLAPLAQLVDGGSADAELLGHLPGPTGAARRSRGRGVSPEGALGRWKHGRSKLPAKTSDGLGRLDRFTTPRPNGSNNL